MGLTSLLNPSFLPPAAPACPWLALKPQAAAAYFHPVGFLTDFCFLSFLLVFPIAQHERAERILLL
jgi:hypothetical protein